MPKSRSKKSLQKRDAPEIAIAHIAAKAATKTIDQPSLTVYRNGFIVWEVTNMQKSGNLTVEISDFVAQKPGSPAKPVQTSGPVTVAPGKSGQINAAVDGRGQGKGKRKYTYNVVINGDTVDPEIVVCDDPNPYPPLAKRAAKKKAARKRAPKK